MVCESLKHVACASLPSSPLWSRRHSRIYAFHPIHTHIGKREYVNNHPWLSNRRPTRHADEIRRVSRWIGVVYSVREARLHARCGGITPAPHTHTHAYTNMVACKVTTQHQQLVGVMCGETFYTGHDKVGPHHRTRDKGALCNKVAAEYPSFPLKQREPCMQD